MKKVALLFAGQGAQAVGMSTVSEAIAVRHMGVRVGALSCIANLAAGITPQRLDHADVESTVAARKGSIEKLLSGWIARAGTLS